MQIELSERLQYQLRIMICFENKNFGNNCLNWQKRLNGT